jgi:TolA-binding protein
VQQYPAAATLNPALLWLARLESSAGNYRRAADFYLRVDPASEQALVAATELGQVSGRYLESLSGQPDRAQSEARSLSDAIAAKFSAATGGKGIAGSDSTRALLLSACSLGLRYGTLGSKQIADWLNASLAGVALDDAWREPAGAHLLAALSLDQEQQGRALELVGALRLPSSLELALQLLEPVAARNPAANPLRLAVIGQLLAITGEEPTKRTELLLQQASIWEASGEEAKALASLEELAGQLPRRLDVQLQLARSLAKSPERQEAALNQWRRVSAGVKDRSDEWYEAKYQVARLLLESGKPMEAKQLLDYLSVVPPGWSQSKWKREFDELHARCK